MSSPIIPSKAIVIRPTPMTIHMRNFLPWQIIRFIIINIKMTLMIMKSHDSEVEVKK